MCAIYNIGTVNGVRDDCPSLSFLFDAAHWESKEKHYFAVFVSMLYVGGTRATRRRMQRGPRYLQRRHRPVAAVIRLLSNARAESSDRLKTFRANDICKAIKSSVVEKLALK